MCPSGTIGTARARGRVRSRSGSRGSGRLYTLHDWPPDLAFFTKRTVRQLHSPHFLEIPTGQIRASLSCCSPPNLRTGRLRHLRSHRSPDFKTPGPTNASWPARRAGCPFLRGVIRPGSIWSERTLTQRYLIGSRTERGLAILGGRASARLSSTLRLRPEGSSPWSVRAAVERGSPSQNRARGRRVNPATRPRRPRWPGRS